jgi:hypothetical protein
MKRDRTAMGALAMAVAAACAVGCARPEPPRAPTTSVTELTAAVEPASTEAAPKVGKSQRALDDAEQDALDPKGPRSREGVARRSGAFGRWK